MRIDKVYIKEFKNLKEFRIDLDERYTETVLIGQNASGKSNFIEALVLIFKYLDLKQTPKGSDYFEYEIDYICKDSKIHIALKDNSYAFRLANQPLAKSKFYDNKNLFLPKNVFTYYSGISNRLKSHFDEHQRRFYDKVIENGVTKEEVEDLRRLFYVQLFHSFFVLMAFYAFDEDEKATQPFLKEVLKIEDMGSVLFVLKLPEWAKSKAKIAKEDRFWTAAGLVREFLDKAWKVSIAPIYNEEKIDVGFRQRETQSRLYLYIPNKEKLKELASSYGSTRDFFKALESLHISDLVEDVRVKVQKRGVDDKITFKELSEGEQQILTVIGNLRFTKDEESLILLDEPDTHLNPLWKWRYLEYLKKFYQNDQNENSTTQIIFNTHDPLVIGGLEKEQVRIFSTQADGTTEVYEPKKAPKGMGVAGILTSELFGLPTTLDFKSQELLDDRNKLLQKQQKNKLTEKERLKLSEIFDKLNSLGFATSFRDPLYQTFIRALDGYKEFEETQPLTREDIDKQDKIAISILEQIFKEEKEK